MTPHHNQGMDELDKIANEIDSTTNGDDDQQESDSGDTDDINELSKEEIAEEFDVQFAKKSGNSVQHLVQPDGDDTLCGVGLGSDVKRIERPGPFDPICERCRSSIGTSGQTYSELRRWLADEIEGVDEPKTDDSGDPFDKAEAVAIVDHIQSLKD